MVPCTWKWKPLCFLPTRLIYSCHLFTSSLKLICPQGAFCSALWGVPLHKPVGAASAAAWLATLAGTETLTSNMLGLGTLSKHVFPLLLLLHTLPSHQPFLEMGWGWSRLWSVLQVPLQGVNGLLLRKVAKASWALRWRPEHTPKSHGGCKVGSCQKYTKRNPLGHVWHPWCATRMLSLGVLGWWGAAATLLSPPGPRELHEAARCVQGSAATGLSPVFALKF